MFKLNFLPFKFLVKRSFLNNFQIKSLQTKSIASILDIDLNKVNSDSPIVLDKLRVVGWVKNFRDQKEIKFLHINDGSDSRNLQLVILMNEFKQSNKDKDLTKLFNSIHFNSSVEVIGCLVKSTHKKQNYELRVNEMNIINDCEPDNYPFQFRSSYSLEQIRQHIPLRSHTNLFAAIMRFRSQLTMSFHEFFNKNNFIQVHTPILTSNNCEGGCETFQVNINDKDKSMSSIKLEDNVDFKLEKDSDVKQFFLKPVYLTASAQLHLETMTSTLSKVYTLSPTFRAEKSMTRHHLAEFYMLEVELIDMNNLGQLLDIVESLIKNVSLSVYEKYNKYDLDIILSETGYRK
jgi:asparaginyl-tRNA synthetase